MHWTNKRGFSINRIFAECNAWKIFAAKIHDPENFGEPDDITAKTGECRWIAYEDCKSAARDDHYEIITDMYNSLVASEETVTN